MLFNSFEFLLFFLVVVPLHFALPQRVRWFWLLAASCVFYMAFIPMYILILLFTIVVDYFAGIWIEAAHGFRRRLFLWMSLAANVGMLAIFKYYGFLTSNLNQLLSFMGVPWLLPALRIILPIGLSFHTFQAMSYTIEVYRGRQKVERHFGIYALYVMFFPQLVAGPIERPQNLLHQFHETHRVDYGRWVEGLRLMLYGLFKKVVVADNLGLVVNTVYTKPSHFSGHALLLATLFFAFQIYCDFSGYSDIAIGVARVMGYDLMTNFRRPYFATSIADFWRRWHISLSTWFRDYLYIPLGGSRAALPRVCLNLMIVFLVSGLWHGAAWSFVVWGALHGFYLVAGKLSAPGRTAFRRRLGLERFPRLLWIGQAGCVFALVTVAWVFFRARSFRDAGYILAHMFNRGGPPMMSTLREMGLPIFEMVVAVVSVAGLLGMDRLLEAPPQWARKLWAIRACRWTVYLAGCYAIVFFGWFGRVEFIYFQF
ncbi:MAG: MBOAT family O-acyltransferase [Verrucomicrobiota bacterium]|jgi:D-alanyl-lipoteichoic acid acyltransferase DltB (MBOAT superfamily)